MVSLALSHQPYGSMDAQAATPTSTGGRVRQVATPVPQSEGTTPPAGTAPATVTAPGGTLRRRDVVPGGANMFLGFGQAGGPGWCTLSPGGIVEERGSQPGCPIQIASLTDLVIRGFDLTQPLRFEVTGPGGYAYQQQIPAARPDEDFHEMTWLSRPGDATGTYQIRISQGARVEQYVVSVSPADGPQAAPWPEAGPPGTTFTITLAGFTPGATVPVRLYRHVGSAEGAPTLAYSTTLGTVTMNRRGEGVLNLPTDQDDPEGLYSVQTTPPMGGNASVDRRLFRLDRSSAVRSGMFAGLTEPPLSELAQAVIEHANHVWASVIAKSGAPVSTLSCVYGGRWLQQVRASVEAMRSRGQYREANMTSGVRVTSAREIEWRGEESWDTSAIEAIAEETWSDKLFMSDGTPITTMPANVRQRYLINGGSGSVPDECGWVQRVIVESEIERQ